MLTLIYTSGTTGPPKGVQLTHRNMMATVRVADDVIKFADGAKVISWLPAAHIAERNAHHYLPIVFAMTITCCPNPREIVAYLPAVKPSSRCRASSRSPQSDIPLSSPTGIPIAWKKTSTSRGVARRRLRPDGSGSARSGRPRRASSCAWLETASCWCAATS